MPCFKQEKSLEFRSRRDTTNDRDPMAPKPVRPRAMRYHGLFGMSIAAQHLIVDEKWTPSCITDLYGNMAELLKRRVIYKQHETRTHRALLLVENKRVKTECADGRLKLQKISVGNNAHEIRNMLNNHSSLQRLYQRMPIYLVADNINQRTFVMRKERDRLDARLQQLKQKYRVLLMERSRAVNMIKYENEYILQEELQSRVLLKKIENSNVRLNAIRTINTTYKKMRQVLLQDEIFYEPILRSLDDDMEDQVNFIKHILYLGMPAIAKFKVLNRELLQLSEKARNNQLAKIQILNSLKKPIVIGPPQVVVREIQTNNPKRYLRLTESMAILKAELQTIENTIKNLRLTVLCSQAKEIYPRAKSQIKKNHQVSRQIVCEHLRRDVLEEKQVSASMLRGVLVHNLNEEEIKRLTYIETLKNELQKEKEIQKDTLEYIQNRAKAFIMIRLFLWNLAEILRSIDRSPYSTRRRYRTSYLRLPLLKFELYTMLAMAPPIFKEDIEKIMHLVKRKLYKLVQAYQNVPLRDLNTKKFVDEYHSRYMDRMRLSADRQSSQLIEPRISFEDDKVDPAILTRKQIKAKSSKILEEIRESYD
ncbi:PREDICTED: uncharacterized protein LOC108621720 isoform X2 [Drosophila arizonae]|uniref:Uncharacterized protein LOC108621720 isoform X2 n=1 Tax=Drosophila arizonae TaxID=7263 RepID=A0ABM1Q5F9_DROAR|nr:PREDICTED: uncharacterized protein LOC108621720 isoform X2 [Drosophila arizonae]